MRSHETGQGARAARMQTLCDQGVEFSLDDFGTGFASLAYLRHLPISEVKIDRSYVQKMLVDAHDRALASAVIHLCKELDMRVVAEGVETLEQYAMLCALGCDRFQGFLFGKAVAPINLFGVTDYWRTNSSALPPGRP